MKSTHYEGHNYTCSFFILLLPLSSVQIYSSALILANKIVDFNTKIITLPSISCHTAWQGQTQICFLTSDSYPSTAHVVHHLCSSEINASNLCTGLDRPLGHQEVESPRISRQKWHMNMARLSDPLTGHLYAPQHPQVFIFVWGWADPRGQSVAIRLSQSKISITQSELKLTTFWLVPHCFNHLHHCHYTFVCKCMFLTSNA